MYVSIFLIYHRVYLSSSPMETELQSCNIFSIDLTEKMKVTVFLVIHNSLFIISAYCLHITYYIYYIYTRPFTPYSTMISNSPISAGFTFQSVKNYLLYSLSTALRIYAYTCLTCLSTTITFSLPSISCHLSTASSVKLTVSLKFPLLNHTSAVQQEVPNIDLTLHLHQNSYKSSCSSPYT